MTRAEAEHVAALINQRNELPEAYTPEAILRNAQRYEFEVREGVVVACVERKRVQWYQWEIRHLSVPEAWEGKGVAYAVYSRAESTARSGGASLLQCTIREGNEASEKFFRRQGFGKACTFFNPNTRNTVGVWLKALPPPDHASVGAADGALM